MQFIVLLILVALASGGQTPPSPRVPDVPGPPTPVPAVAIPAEPIASNEVVIEVNGKKYTKAEMDVFIAELPMQYQQAVRSQPETLSQILLFRQLAEDAEKEGLDKQSPYKEALAYQRIDTLARAELYIHSNSFRVSAEEQEKYYKENPGKFKQAKVRVIFVNFSTSQNKIGADGKKLLTEAEAKSKLDGFRTQILAGADFGKVARENSEDKASAEKGGDFGFINHSSSLPEPLKNAEFALSQGELSDRSRSLMVSISFGWTRSVYDPTTKLAPRFFLS